MTEETVTGFCWLNATFLTVRYNRITFVKRPINSRVLSLSIVTYSTCKSHGRHRVTDDVREKISRTDDKLIFRLLFANKAGVSMAWLGGQIGAKLGVIWDVNGTFNLISVMSIQSRVSRVNLPEQCSADRIFDRLTNNCQWIRIKRKKRKRWRYIRPLQDANTQKLRSSNYFPW